LICQKITYFVAVNCFYLLYFWLMTISVPDTTAGLVAAVRDDSLFSVPLKRSVRLDVLLPPNYNPQNSTRYPTLYLNDGQDLPRLKMRAVLDSLYRKNAIRPFVLVAIHAADRIQEYGTASRPDYMKRGSRAAAYTDFMLTELVPHIQKQYHVSREPQQTVLAGFSLGGLSAMDIVWSHPRQFGRVGVFSGSFWWRKKAFEKGYDDDRDRIMQLLVREGKHKPGLKFWLQTGTLDETDDRNNNGVIDAIDDTLDLIRELEAKGYRNNTDIRYVEVKGGHHDQETWSAIMPDFLMWAFGK
jgi:enterochelin esterase-like enzyme